MINLEDARSDLVDVHFNFESIKLTQNSIQFVVYTEQTDKHTSATVDPYSVIRANNDKTDKTAISNNRHPENISATLVIYS